MLLRAQIHQILPPPKRGLLPYIDESLANCTASSNGLSTMQFAIDSVRNKISKLETLKTVGPPVTDLPETRPNVVK